MEDFDSSDGLSDDDQQGQRLNQHDRRQAMSIIAREAEDRPLEQATRKEARIRTRSKSLIIPHLEEHSGVLFNRMHT
jgi:hypothetical protein